MPSTGYGLGTKLTPVWLCIGKFVTMPYAMFSEVVSIWKLSHGMTNHQHDLCAQRRLRSAWASAQSDQSQRCSPEAKLGPKLPIDRTAKTLIRLGGCPGWSESSLGTKIILLVLSWGGPKSTYAEHIHFITFFFFLFTFRIEPNMKSFSHAYNIVLRRDIYIHSLKLTLNWSYFLSCKRNIVCSNSASFDFVKDECAVGSAVLGKREYNLISTQSMVLFHENQRQKTFYFINLFFFFFFF